MAAKIETPKSRRADRAFRKSLAAALKRRMQGKTYRAVAAKTYIGHEQLSNICRGRGLPAMATLLDLARALGARPAEFFPGEP